MDREHSRGGREFARFIAAAKKGRCQALAKALGVNPALTKRTDADARSALMVAAEHGQAACVRLLLPLSDANALVYFPYDGMSALMRAASLGHASCVETLLAASDPFATNNGKKSALMFAAREGHAECVKLLMTFNDPLAVENHGCSALIFAASKGHAECVELLLPVSDLSQRDRWDRTALDIARMYGHGEIVLSFGRYAARREAMEISEAMEAAPVAQARAPTKSKRSARP